jgi:hypothetical protein
VSRPNTLRRPARIAVLVVGLTLAIGVPQASAVTIGQLAPDVPPEDSCADSPFDLLQPTVVSGNGYVVPSTGGVSSWTVTSWSTNNRGAANTMSLKMFRPAGGPNEFQVVGHDGPHPVQPGVNTFSANLRVGSGDVLGLHSGIGDCAFDAPDNPILFLTDTDLADGDKRTFESDSGFLLNATAEVVPVNAFTVGKPRAKRNGTAVVQVDLPNPGDLSVRGKGVKGSASAVKATSVGAGTVKLVIRAKGKKKGKLARTGRVKVVPTITYTPNGGAATSQTTKVKLRRK